MSLPLPESLNALLTEAECTQIDQTLLPTRDRFNIRLKVYAARYLSQIASRLETSVSSLTPDQIAAELKQDPSLKQEDGALEEPFANWFGSLLTSSLSPLEQIAKDTDVVIEALRLEQIIEWHRQRVDLN
ncbi:MAG: hypothetical protein AAGB01_05790 [Cyanobacteria bacterium P01_F01_bin.42]